MGEVDAALARIANTFLEGGALANRQRSISMEIEEVSMHNIAVQQFEELAASKSKEAVALGSGYLPDNYEADQKDLRDMYHHLIDKNGEFSKRGLDELKFSLDQRIISNDSVLHMYSVQSSVKRGAERHLLVLNNEVANSAEDPYGLTLNLERFRKVSIGQSGTAENPDPGSAFGDQSSPGSDLTFRFFEPPQQATITKLGKSEIYKSSILGLNREGTPESLAQSKKFLDLYKEDMTEVLGASEYNALVGQWSDKVKTESANWVAKQTKVRGELTFKLNKAARGGRRELEAFNNSPEGQLLEKLGGSTMEKWEGLYKIADDFDRARFRLSREHNIGDAASPGPEDRAILDELESNIAGDIFDHAKGLLKMTDVEAFGEAIAGVSAEGGFYVNKNDADVLMSLWRSGIIGANSSEAERAAISEGMMSVIQKDPEAFLTHKRNVDFIKAVNSNVDFQTAHQIFEGTKLASKNPEGIKARQLTLGAMSNETIEDLINSISEQKFAHRTNSWAPDGFLEFEIPNISIWVTGSGAIPLTMISDIRTAAAVYVEADYLPENAIGMAIHDIISLQRGQWHWETMGDNRWTTKGLQDLGITEHASKGILIDTLIKTGIRDELDFTSPLPLFAPSVVVLDAMGYDVSDRPSFLGWDQITRDAEINGFFLQSTPLVGGGTGWALFLRDGDGFTAEPVNWPPGSGRSGQIIRKLDDPRIHNSKTWNDVKMKTDGLDENGMPWWPGRYVQASMDFIDAYRSFNNPEPGSSTEGYVKPAHADRNADYEGPGPPGPPRPGSTRPPWTDAWAKTIHGDE